MKLRTLLIASCSLLAASALRAADEHPAHAPGMHADGHEKHTELGEHMESIGRAFRVLGRQVADATKNENSLKQVAIIRKNAQAAAKLQPEKTADIPADQKDKFLADYNEHMKAFLGDIDALETALKAGNNAEASEVVKKMKQQMDESHKEFRKKKPRK